MTMELQWGNQTINLDTNLSYRDKVSIVKLTLDALIQEDSVTGAPARDVTMEMPLLLFFLLKLKSDMDMTSYIEGTKDIMDLYDIYEHDENAVMEDIMNELCDIYDREAENKMDNIRDKNSVSCQLRIILKTLLGTTDGKDIGLIRAMMTETLMKEKEKVKGKNKSMVDADLSLFKPKHDK